MEPPRHKSPHAEGEVYDKNSAAIIAVGLNNIFLELAMRGCVAVSLLLLAGRACAGDGFAGTWETSFGPMTLKVDGDVVHGTYELDGQSCRLEGKLDKKRLNFRYQEPNARGEGWFELADDGQSFAGRWREEGKKAYAVWTGKRVGAAAAKATGFGGLWQTTFGRLRLTQDGDRVAGVYTYAGGSTIEGKVEGNKLAFRYKEPEAAGEGVFELAADGKSFVGTWKAQGASRPQSWTGERVEPKPGVIWLVVVEARWEASLADEEYTFGGMLKAFFARSSRVQVRQRFFTDEASLKRWCGELAYLAEPAVLVIASHASTKGVQADGRTVPAVVFADCLRHAATLKLLHFSACEIMRDKSAETIMAGIDKPNRFPISGYTTTVDWAASAIIEFAYLELVLMRGLAPAKAAEQIGKLISFSGPSAPSSPFGAAGFRLLKPD
jgi:hypothetical protein